MTQPIDPTRPTETGAAHEAPDRFATPASPAPEAPRPDRPAAPAPSPAPTPPAPGKTPGDREVPEESPQRRGGPTAALWVSLILGAVVLVLLLIFVIQNNVPASFQYFGATFSLPLGVAMLFAAIAGALVMGLVGSVRMVQLSMTVRRLRKHEKKIRTAIDR